MPLSVAGVAGQTFEDQKTTCIHALSSQAEVEGQPRELSPMAEAAGALLVRPARIIVTAAVRTRDPASPAQAPAQALPRRIISSSAKQALSVRGASLNFTAALAEEDGGEGQGVSITQAEAEGAAMQQSAQSKNKQTAVQPAMVTAGF